MNLQYILYHLSFLAIYFPFSKSTPNQEIVTMKTGLGEISPCSIGLQLYAELNNTADEDFFVELISDECCINFREDMDCDSIEIIGESSEIIKKGKSKKIILIAPVIDPFERSGYCTIHVDSRPVDKRNNIMRDTINIDFDTMLKDNADNNPDIIKKCNNLDEDPLNDCKPVNCDIYYNGKKPIYDEVTKRCTEAPKCRSKKSEDSDMFDSETNKCMVVDPIENADLEFIKTLYKDKRPAKNVIIVESPEKTVQTCLFDTQSSDKYDVTGKAKLDTKRTFKFIDCAMKYLATNKYTLLILVVVVFVQCFLICIMIYWLAKRPPQCGQKKVERKYFNYRQDVSMTTPLIATSNIDTETAFDCISESGNVEKKFKCYKACQKLKQNDPKVSMSDDILTKCLNRRDWKTTPKSDITKDVNNYTNSCNPEWKTLLSNLKETTIKTHISKKEQATDTETKKDKQDYTDSDSSEKFIKCHDYNLAQSIKVETDNRNKKSISISTEKGAQACFSNDSIDDFLSERGILFLANDQMPKYSFTSSTSNQTNQTTSSKTSKNRNIIKNVLSYFSNKSKKYTSSDPGEKRDKGTSLELIHMSRASMCSSSNSEYKNIQGVRLGKDYRSTF